MHFYFSNFQTRFTDDCRRRAQQIIEDKFQALEKPQEIKYSNANTTQHITCLLGALFAHL
jgi:hypothetical protein